MTVESPATEGSSSSDDYLAFAEQYKVAYELALKGLDQQQQTLDGIRQRASVLLGAAAIVTTFLGRRPPLASRRR